ncbi:MAG: DUF4421 family protein [Flavobacteriaceae bacterium]|nr:DUF4421 family protein [Flavobacteriaceae bacterium]
MKRYQPICFILLYISVSFDVFAQETDTTANKPSNIYFEKLDHYFTLKLSQSNDTEKFSIQTVDNELIISPNVKSESHVHVSYKYISFSIKYVAEFLPGNDDDAQRGETKSGGFGLSLNFNRWLQELSYGKTTGYYIENTSDYIPGWQQGDPYILIPDLVYKNFQGLTGYKFNPNFSFNAISTQSERQLKSAGSFVPHILYRYYIIDDEQEVTESRSTQKSNNFELVVGAGYYYTLVLKKDFYISFGITPGAGYLRSKIVTRFPNEEFETSQDNLLIRIDGRAGAGYNGKKFYAGIYSKLSGSFYTQEDSSVTNEDSKVVFQAFVGYRFNAPNWLKKTVRTIEESTGLDKIL